MDGRQIQLTVVGVRLEVSSNQPVVMLRGAESGCEHLHVAIVIGTAEATAVSMALEERRPPRPMTHDLLAATLQDLAGGVAGIEIHLLDSSTYAAAMRLEDGRTLDARASDAVAVAVRLDRVPISMREDTLRAVAVTPGGPASSESGQRAEPPPGVSPEAHELAKKGPISAEEIREFQKFLDGAEPEDFDGSS